MIQIVKGIAPTVLTTKGVTETQKNLADYQNGTIKFKILNSIYNHDSVKATLEKAQHEKCCFCETKPIRSFGDVEHFRPKNAYRIKGNSAYQYPGYFWLAYSWDNLFFSCEVCNRVFKRNYFPIEDETTRAPLNNLDISNEANLIINPQTENPEDYIAYRAYQPYAINDNLKGKTTIELCGLKVVKSRHRTEKLRKRIKKLVDERAKYYGHMKLHYKNYTTDVDVRTLFANAVKPSAQWSLMIKCALKDNFKY